MKRRKKRLLSLALCMILMLSACGSQESGTTDTTEGTTGAETTTTESSSAQGTDSSLWFDEELVITILMQDNTAQPLIDYAPAQQEIHRKTNVKLEYQIVPQSSFTEKQNVLLATNNFPDMIKVTTSNITSYAEEGIFVPLMQYVNEETMPNFYRLWQEYEEKMVKYLVNDELYAFPVIQRDEARNGFGIVLRTDLLEKHDLEIPDTFDELIDVMASLKEIYPDSIPYTGRKGTSQLLSTVSYMLGSGADLYYDYDVDGGRVVFGPATENFKAVLSFLNECYERGVLDPDFATTTSEQLQSKMTSGQSFMFIDNSGFGQNYTQLLRTQEGYEDATLQVIPIPENSFGQRRAVAYETVLADRLFAINSSVDRLDDIIKFIDWLYSEEGSNITNYGVEGESFYVDEEGEPHFIEEYINNVDDTGFQSKYYAVYTELGITKLNFSLWCTNTKTTFEIQRITGDWNDVVEEYWQIIEADDAYVDPYIMPALTLEESERVTDLLTSLTTMLEQEYNKYIMGIEPIENWDNVIQRAEELGAREIEDIYNAADARYTAALQ